MVSIDNSKPVINRNSKKALPRGQRHYKNSLLKNEVYRKMIGEVSRENKRKKFVENKPVYKEYLRDTDKLSPKSQEYFDYIKVHLKYFAEMQRLESNAKVTRLQFDKYIRTRRALDKISYYICKPNKPSTRTLVGYDTQKIEKHIRGFVCIRTRTHPSTSWTSTNSYSTNISKKISSTSNTNTSSTNISNENENSSELLVTDSTHVKHLCRGVLRRKMDLNFQDEVKRSACSETNTAAAFKTPGHTYVVPSKCVKNIADMGIWQKSEAYYDLLGFINGISVAIQGKRNSHNCAVSEIMQRLLDIFAKLNELVDQTPPIDQPQRFGNQAYRIWFQKMKENAHQYLKEALGEKYADAVVEIVHYFIESFGNQTRIDYGTGHELSFIMFLCCLFKINALTEKDNLACALKFFNTYLIFVRRLQKIYRMEPAGSHGVWSLDDYQFVPFIWGSAQLAVNSPFDPQKFLDDEIIQEYKNEYMFIGCIDYICQVKTGHFAEHSNQLWSISAVQSWSKINAGLVKMYQNELLSKFPVVQHILFGSLMVFKTVKPGRVLPNVRLGIMPPPPPTLKPVHASGDSS